MARLYSLIHTHRCGSVVWAGFNRRLLKQESTQNIGVNLENSDKTNEWETDPRGTSSGKKHILKERRGRTEKRKMDAKGGAP